MRMDSEELVDNLMETAAFEIESVELLQAWQTNAVAFGAINGCVNIKTRNATRDKKDVRSKGTFYTPIGLTPHEDIKTNTADNSAELAGNKHLAIDIIGHDGVKSVIVTCDK